MDKLKSSVAIILFSVFYVSVLAVCGKYLYLNSSVFDEQRAGGSRAFMSAITLMTDYATTTNSTTLDLAGTIRGDDYENVIVAVETTGNASGTINFAGTILDNPDFDPTQTSSSTNQWDNLQIVDLEDGTSYDGDEGILVSGTDIHKMFEINVNALAWIRPYLSTYSTGTFFIYGIATN